MCTAEHNPARHLGTQLQSHAHAHSTARFSTAHLGTAHSRSTPALSDSCVTQLTKLVATVCSDPCLTNWFWTHICSQSCMQIECARLTTTNQACWPAHLYLSRILAICTHSLGPTLLLSLLNTTCNTSGPCVSSQCMSKRPVLLMSKHKRTVAARLMPQAASQQANQPVCKRPVLPPA